LKTLDGFNPEEVQREQELRDEVMDSEILLIDAIEEARAALGHRQENPRDAGLDVAECALEKWDELADNLKELILKKKAESEANRNPPALPPGMVRSDRVAQVLEKKADDTDKAVAELSEIETPLRSECAAIASARAAEEEYALSPREDNSTGALESNSKDLLASYAKPHKHRGVLGRYSRRVGCAVFPRQARGDTRRAERKDEQAHGNQVAGDFYW